MSAWDALLSEVADAIEAEARHHAGGYPDEAALKVARAIRRVADAHGDS